jgi:transcriptional regulator with XRE-family HTH domain
MMQHCQRRIFVRRPRCAPKQAIPLILKRRISGIEQSVRWVSTLPVEEGRHQTMMQTVSVRRTLVGTMLRQYREALDLKIEDAAHILECDNSKISRIETGQRGIRPKELRELLGEYGVDSATQDTLATICSPRSSGDWWQHYRKVLPGPYLDFMLTEGVASQIMVYAPLRMPDLLATPDYARATAEADITVPDGMEEARVQAIVAHRQVKMFGREPAVSVILGEAALRQQVGDRVAMREQFAHLEALSDAHAWLNIRILPFSAGATAGSDVGAFSLLQFSELPEVGLAHLAGPAGGIYIDDDMLVAAYAKTFTHLAWYASTREQSLTKFHELAGR